MANYITTGFKLSESQKAKLVRGAQNKEATTIQISKTDLEGGVSNLPMTKRQLTKINKLKSGHSANITFSKTQLKHLVSAGFLQFLAPVLASLAGAAIAPIGKAAGEALADAAPKAFKGIKKLVTGKGLRLPTERGTGLELPGTAPARRSRTKPNKNGIN